MEINVLYLKFQGIDCRFNGLTWNYFFHRQRNFFTIHSSVSWLLLTSSCQ